MFFNNANILSFSITDENFHYPNDQNFVEDQSMCRCITNSKLFSITILFFSTQEIAKLIVSVITV